MSAPTPDLSGLNGHQIAALLEARAAELGVPLGKFLAPICPGRCRHSYLKMIRRAKSPTALTRERIAALLAAAPVPPARSYQMTRHGPAQREPSRPPVLSPRRDPCFKCGVRGDIGCAHQPAEWAA